MSQKYNENRFSIYAAILLSTLLLLFFARAWLPVPNTPVVVSTSIEKNYVVEQQVMENDLLFPNSGEILHSLENPAARRMKKLIRVKRRQRHPYILRQSEISKNALSKVSRFNHTEKQRKLLHMIQKLENKLDSNKHGAPLVVKQILERIPKKRGNSLVQYNREDYQELSDTNTSVIPINEYIKSARRVETTDDGSKKIVYHFNEAKTLPPLPILPSAVANPSLQNALLEQKKMKRKLKKGRAAMRKRLDEEEKQDKKREEEENEEALPEDDQPEEDLPLPESNEQTETNPRSQESSENGPPKAQRRLVFRSFANDDPPNHDQQDGQDPPRGESSENVPTKPTHIMSRSLGADDPADHDQPEVGDHPRSVESENGPPKTPTRLIFRSFANDDPPNHDQQDLPRSESSENGSPKQPTHLMSRSLGADDPADLDQQDVEDHPGSDSSENVPTEPARMMSRSLGANPAADQDEQDHGDLPLKINAEGRVDLSNYFNDKYRNVVITRAPKINTTTTAKPPVKSLELKDDENISAEAVSEKYFVSEADKIRKKHHSRKLKGVKHHRDHPDGGVKWRFDYEFGIVQVQQEPKIENPTLDS